MGFLVMQPAAHDDTALVRETLGGNPLSFRLLVERYQDRIFGLARHYAQSAVEVEDIVQDTFLKAFRRLDTFQHASSFSTWLHKIAVNTALDFLKRAGRNPVQAVEDPEVLGTAPETAVRIGAPSARLEREEVAAITHRVLEELPEIFRTALILREFEGLTYQEMAETLGISIGTVESRLFRARARFRAALARLYPEYAELD
ncbi:MAG: sigma-70 family RNA polymerase sigma factor [Planctomycetota bacterium]